MRRHQSNHRYATWSLEATADILSAKFGPDALVVVVRPSEYYLGTFSIFRNFVASSDSMGSPLFNSNKVTGWRQLELVMEAVREKISEEEVLKLLANCHLGSYHETPLTLIGFSKGCVVLNQLLHEFVFMRGLTESDPRKPSMPSNVEEMYWLDGGHNGASDTWLTEEAVIESVAEFYKDKKLELSVHVTPYQMNDARRPHIGRHKAAFCEFVRKHGMILSDKLHFVNQKRTIDVHFEVLTAF